ncbi:MAG: AAA family ATPase [Oscillospiraceae bacterium]|jgi:septum site-determining protein MinD|nr:AAA family ATPase [Oscillospiraceae bacterium]
MGRAVVFISGKGGTGKTSAVAAVSSYLVLQGKSVVCVDADPLGGLDLALGVGERTLYNLGDAAGGACSLKDALIEINEVPPGQARHIGQFRFASLGTGDSVFAALAENLKKRCDWLLIDAPAGLSVDYPADTAIYVVNADSVNYRAASMIGVSGDFANSFMIANRVKPNLLARFDATLDDAIDTVGVRLLGYVPEDETVTTAMLRGRPLAFYKLHSDESPAQRSYREICDRLVNNADLFYSRAG